MQTYKSFSAFLSSLAGISGPMADSILKKFDAGVLHVSLNNTDRNNALTIDMLKELKKIFSAVTNYPETRVIVLRGEGKSFCTGVDLRHLDAATNHNRAQHKSDTKLLSDTLQAIVQCPIPVIGIGHGTIFGVGIGLLAAADIAVAFESTTFCFSEVNLGLVPAIISPYVIARIGHANARRFFLSGEIFQWWDAKEMNLVNYAGTKMACFEFLNSVINHLKKGAPGAQRDTKAMLNTHAKFSKQPVNLINYLIDATVKRRETAESHEGVTAFIERREPDWR